MDQLLIKQLLTEIKIVRAEVKHLDEKLDSLIAQENKNSTDIVWMKSAGKAVLSVLFTIVAGAVSYLVGTK